MRIANLTQSNPWFVYSNIYVRRSQLERQEFLNRMTTMVKRNKHLHANKAYVTSRKSIVDRLSGCLVFRLIIAANWITQQQQTGICKHDCDVFHVLMRGGSRGESYIVRSDRTNDNTPGNSINTHPQIKRVEYEQSCRGIKKGVLVCLNPRMVRIPSACWVEDLWGTEIFPRIVFLRFDYSGFVTWGYVV
jgi:hypothetical protein